MKCNNIDPLENRECGVSEIENKIKAIQEWLISGSMGIDNGCGLQFRVKDLKFCTVFGSIEDCKFYNSNGEVIFHGKYKDGIPLLKQEEQSFIANLLDEIIEERPSFQKVKQDLIDSGYFNKSQNKNNHAKT